MDALAGPSRDAGQSPYSTSRPGSVSEDAGSDWLEDSDDERRVQDTQDATYNGQGSQGITSTPSDRRMGERDMDKVQRKLYDEGYREGISAGKEAMIQPAFDTGYAATGVPAGRALGNIKGTLHALSTMLTQQAKRSEGAIDSTKGRDLLHEVLTLQRETSALRIDDIIAPDWEAIEHEREHASEDAVSARDLVAPQRETLEQVHIREQRLPLLQQRADVLAKQVLTHVATSHSRA